MYVNHTTHNSFISSDEVLTLETSAVEILLQRQIYVSIQLLKPIYLQWSA